MSAVILNPDDLDVAVSFKLWHNPSTLPDEYAFARSWLYKAAKMHYVIANERSSDFLSSCAGGYNPSEKLKTEVLQYAEAPWYAHDGKMYYYIDFKDGRAKVYLPEDTAEFRSRINWLSAKFGIKLYLFRNKARYLPGNATFAMWINDGTFFVEAFDKNDCVTATR